MKQFARLIGSVVLTGLLATTGVQAASYSSLVIFGDSLSDSGNNALLPQVGINSAQFIDSNSYVPWATYASGTYSNGPVWATQFAAMMGLEAKPSLGLGGGSNYAFGGAKTGDEPGDLIQQLKMYQQYLQTPGAVKAADTLFVVAGGSNDARAAAIAFSAASSPVAGASAPILAAARQSAANIGAIVDGLQAAGAKHIVVWNVPDLGLTPVGLMSPRFSADSTLVSNIFNVLLDVELADETNLLRYNLFSLQASLPMGTFSNTTDACGAPSNSATCPADIANAFYWDAIHPTTAAHGVLAQQMVALVSAAVPEPSNMAMLAVGLAIVATTVRRRRR